MEEQETHVERVEGDVNVGEQAGQDAQEQTDGAQHSGEQAAEGSEQAEQSGSDS